MILDINECSNNNGGCNQTCKNTVGSYFCKCSEGYVLDAGNHNCSGIYVFFSFKFDISKFLFVEIENCQH